MADEVKLLGQANADLMARKQEIEQLMKVTDEMGVRLNATEIDISMPNRVELIEEASVPEGSDELFRTMLTVLATAAGPGARRGLGRGLRISPRPAEHLEEVGPAAGHAGDRHGAEDHPAGQSRPRGRVRRRGAGGDHADRP